MLSISLALGFSKPSAGEKNIWRAANLDNKQLNDYVPSGPLSTFFQPPDTVWTPHVLKDGSDSVGALGALNRVFLNIGLFSEEWLLHFKPLIGGEQITPIKIKDARKNSTYWEATEAQTPDMALFFLKTTGPHKLKDAPGGDTYLTTDASMLLRGKEIFADRCARCHSSKLPASVQGMDPHGCAGPGYLDCWNKYWKWTKTAEFKQAMKQIVLADDFLDNNFLSNDARIPVTLLETNACSTLATNAIENNIWDNFSSRSYKDLPSVGTITVHHPITGEPRPYQMPAGGRGYTRVTSPRQPVVHRAIPTQQQRGQVRSESERGSPNALVSKLHRTDVMAGETGQGLASWATRSPE